ncbi:hypothetical protein RCL1_008183 [Eukaryota sp. TZLM3-RCL]
MIHCLVELWSNSQVSTEEFSRTLMGFDLSETRFELVHSALSKLFSDEVLRPVLFEFVSVKLFPRLVEENNEHVNLLKVASVQSAVTKLRAEKRFIELRSQEQEGSTLTSGIQFLNSIQGHNVVLSENRLVAARNSAGVSWANSFVGIQHPPIGALVLTLLNFEKSFYTQIGFYTPSSLQAKKRYIDAHSLFVYNDRTQFYINNEPSGPKAKAISKEQQVIIEFNNNRATFSVPSLGYSHKVTCPSDYVFGLAMRRSATSWKLSSR